eukprot:scaffold43483_cov110-Skeletonema_marinoi.AAC.1
MLGSWRVNLHTNNNHLGASQSTNNIYHPGMANHQEPDFTTVTDSFFEASQQPTVAPPFSPRSLPRRLVAAVLLFPARNH